MVSALTTLPDDAFVSLAEFLVWQAREANPLPTLFGEPNGPMLYTGWSHRPATLEEKENLWSHFLKDVLRCRLLPLGCASLGMIEGSTDVYIAIASPGRYLLGSADDFDYGHDHDAQGQIVVQPNFEIVFLAPSPLAEASLARFAQRKSRGVGSLFSITKKSILVAAGSGMTAAQVLETLANLSAKPMPANVAREIAGWFDRCRRINVRSAFLIHCPDADTGRPCGSRRRQEGRLAHGYDRRTDRLASQDRIAPQATWIGNLYGIVQPRLIVADSRFDVQQPLIFSEVPQQVS